MNTQFSLRVFFPVVTVLVVLLIANYFVRHLQHQEQSQMGKGLLRYSEDVSQQLASALMDARHTGVTNCSPDSLNTLRNIRYKYKYLDDIGIIDSGSLACTANWGILINKISLPSYFYTTPSNYRIYKFDGNFKFVKSNHTATVLDNFVVFNSALSFTNFLTFPPDYFMSLNTRDGNELFYTAGKKTDNGRALWRTMFDVETKECSSVRDLCVLTLRTDGGLLSLSLFLNFILLVAGGICGGLLASWIGNQINENKSLERRFLYALKHKKLRMEYQPIARGREGVVGFEALLRWQDEHFGSVSTGLLIGIASKLGQYHRAADFVMECSLNEMGSYLINNPELKLSINMGDEEISSATYLKRLCNECSSRGIRNRQMKLEVTERVSLESSVISSFCKAAKKLGFFVSLDDFGTGTSNIAWLIEFDFDEVKIDKLLVSNIDVPLKQKMLLSIVSGLRKTGKSLVFEGVETEGQFEFICGLDKDFCIQGWYVGKSVGANMVGELLNGGV